MNDYDVCAFRNSCSHGYADIVEWFLNEFKLNVCDFLYIETTDDKWSLMKWQCAPFNIVCRDAKVSILELIIKRFQLSGRVLDNILRNVDENWDVLLKVACKKDNKFVVSWLVTNFPENGIPKKYRKYVCEIQEENDVDIFIKPASKRARVESNNK